MVFEFLLRFQFSDKEARMMINIFDLKYFRCKNLMEFIKTRSRQSSSFENHFKLFVKIPPTSSEIECLPTTHNSSH